MGPTAAALATKLTQAFDPSVLDVVDESHLHAGHSGSRPEGETHFRITIVAACFAATTRAQRHRLIYQALAEELAGPIHALSIDATPPQTPGCT